MVDDLAAIVEKAVVDRVVTELRADGRYDADRRLVEYDDEHVAIPVTATSTHPDIVRFEPGVTERRRPRTLEALLRRRGWSAAEVDLVPSSYARLGHVIAFNEPIEHRPGAVCEALFDLHGDARTVLSIEAIEGARRRPEVRHVGGERTTRVRHREHGTVYEFDLEEVMFSPGNQHERVRMGRVVGRDERVLDMFAGIGYFTLPMARSGARVTAIERNPRSFRWLSLNLTHNAVDRRVVPIRGDCRAVPVQADRVVLGHLPVHDTRDGTPRDDGYLERALDALIDGGTLHVHGIDWADRSARAASALEERIHRLGWTVADLEVRRVKGLAPRTDHLVFDVRVEPA
ncbi:MAG: class I SAM-dependent methyltransferase [Halobacteriota archaeon]